MLSGFYQNERWLYKQFGGTNLELVFGTLVILDDFLSGRGTYMGNYAIDNHADFDSKWMILDIFVSGPSSLCILQRIEGQ